LKSVGVQPFEQARGLLAVTAGMADEDLRHASLRAKTTSKRGATRASATRFRRKY
jgi:hypothetical protein